MRKLIWIPSLSLSIMMLGPSPVEAQRYPISFDVRGGYGVPFGDFSDYTGSDFGFGAGAVFSLTPMIGVYGGWGRDAFSCDLIACDGDSQVRVSGFEVGAKFNLRSGMQALPWAKAGVILHTVELDGGTFNLESDRSIGFQGAIGMDFPIGEVLSVSPAIRLHLLDAEDGEFFEDSSVRYVSFDIGAHIHIPRN